MALIEFPNPAEWLESARTANLEREAANTVLSGVYSFWVTGMWTLGQRKYCSFLADAATSMYLSLTVLEKKGLLALTVPTAMLLPANLSRFTTTEKTK
jgi:hypothetical protein